MQTPILEEAKLTPYFGDQVVGTEEAIKYFVDLVIENMSTFGVTMREDVMKLKESLSGLAATYVQLQPLRNVSLHKTLNQSN